MSPISEVQPAAPESTRKNLTDIFANRSTPQEAKNAVNLAAKLGLFPGPIVELTRSGKLNILEGDLYSLINESDVWILRQQRDKKIDTYTISSTHVYEDTILLRNINEAASSLPLGVKNITGTTLYFIEGHPKVENIFIRYENIPKLMAELRKIAGKISIECESWDKLNKLKEDCKIYTETIHADGTVNLLKRFFNRESVKLDLGRMKELLHIQSDPYVKGELPKVSRENPSEKQTINYLTTLINGAIERQIKIVQLAQTPVIVAPKK